jgi:hypothetical protein
LRRNGDKNVPSIGLQSIVVIDLRMTWSGAWRSGAWIFLLAALPLGCGNVRAIADAHDGSALDAIADAHDGSVPDAIADAADAPAPPADVASDSAPDAAGEAGPETGHDAIVDAIVDAILDDIVDATIDAPAGDAAPAGVLLTVVKRGDGIGTVPSNVTGIDCGTTCSARFTAASVVLSARTSNGSGSWFVGWGGACSGAARDCTVTLGEVATVTARFEPMTNNLVFVSSQQTLPPNLGSAAAYDARCNTLATAAGINSATSDAFVAWVSDSHASAAARLGAARGFVRMDGQPVADDLATLVTNNRLLYPITLDENGGPSRPTCIVLTGMDIVGAASSNCSDWTSTSSSQTVTAGCAGCGPALWYYWETDPCSTMVGSVCCFMKTRTAALSPTPVVGRKIFLSNGPVSSSESADARCDASKPAGTGTVSALRSTSAAAASSMLVAGTTYVRPDGVAVGQMADLLAGQLTSGIWQQGDGTYINNTYVWTGSASPSAAAGAATNCADWTTAASTATVGSTPGTDLGWWSNSSVACSSTRIWSICVER